MELETYLLPKRTLCLSILFSDDFRAEGNNLFKIRVNDSRADSLQVIGNFTRFFYSPFPCRPWNTVYWRRKIPGSVQVEQIATVHEYHLLKGLTPLQLPKGIFK